MTSCAGTNTIAALLAGAADPAAAEQLELHLDRCASCRRLVADLGRGLSAIGVDDGPGAHARLPQPGETIGRYEIRRVLGVGGMGVVYEARDATLDRAVAIKLLRPDLLEGPSLLAEAQAMARLQHPNIAAVHDAGLANGQLYICMELVTGSTLRAWTSARRRDWREITRLYTAAGEGLAYVHRAGLIHLDFKPDNVLVDRDGRVRVTDFGLARMVGPHRAGASAIVGTPAYMAPEQRGGGSPDARADQYAFCVSLREALGDGRAPRWLRRVLERGLAGHPSDRFASMDDLLAALAAGMAPRRSGVAALAVVASAALAALAVSMLPDPARVITRVVERPVARASPIEVDRTPASTPATRPALLAVAPSGTVLASASPAGRLAARGFIAPHRGPVLRGEPALELSDLAPAPRSRDVIDPARGGDGEHGVCDDGEPISCDLWPPACPGDSLLAVQQGCWTCADVQTCGALGFPATCNDGTPLTCDREPPSCSGTRIPAVRNGCWSCQDPFTCASRSWPQYPPPRKPPKQPTEPDGSASGSASGSSSGSASGSNTGSGGASCGNGLCEAGEDHTACASDCCETTASGECVAQCGNGFCETGEDHATCAADCCALTGSGGCVPECGNGFCETGETVAGCPGDCS